MQRPQPSRRPFRPAIDPLERRDVPAAFLPSELANTPVIHWNAFNATPADLATIQAVMDNVTWGTGLHFEMSGPRRADLMIGVGIAYRGQPAATYGTVRNRGGRPGNASMTLPAGLGADPGRFVDTIAHEVMHSLGFMHEGQGPLAPPYSPPEWARLVAYGAATGTSAVDVVAQYTPQPGVAQWYYDPWSIMEIDPYRHAPVAGPGPHLSYGDRWALAHLFPA